MHLKLFLVTSIISLAAGYENKKGYGAFVFGTTVFLVTGWEEVGWKLAVGMTTVVAAATAAGTPTTYHPPVISLYRSLSPSLFLLPFLLFQGRCNPLRPVTPCSPSPSRARLSFSNRPASRSCWEWETITFGALLI